MKVLQKDHAFLKFGLSFKAPSIEIKKIGLSQDRGSHMIPSILPLSCAVNSEQFPPYFENLNCQVFDRDA